MTGHQPAPKRKARFVLCNFGDGPLIAHTQLKWLEEGCRFKDDHIVTRQIPPRKRKKGK